jgi:hypothetical protein
MWSDTFHNTIIQIHPNSALLASRFPLADAMKTLSIASRLEAQHKVMNSLNCTLRNVDYRH